MFVKICGITRVEDAEVAVALGADAVGFVFWPRSRRFIEPAAARRITRELRGRALAVGVFVNESVERVNVVADHVGLTAVQLHGDEPLEYCARIDRPVIKAVAVEQRVDEERLAAVPSDALLLLDAADAERHGGTGQQVNWHVAAAISRRRPSVLAGGLSVGNVCEAIATVRPFGVDVSTGVESTPGIKDPLKLQAFLAAVRNRYE